MGGAEVDVLLEYNGIFYPIEIKAKSHPDKKDCRGIESFRKTYPKLKTGPGLIISPSENYYPVDDHNWVLFWDAQ